MILKFSITQISLVVVREIDGTLAIVSDTKLTYPDHEVKHQQNQPSEGVLKTVIINPNLCISFAGDMDFVHLAVKEIDTRSTVNDVVAVFFEMSFVVKPKDRFLVCTDSPEAYIYMIREGGDTTHVITRKQKNPF